MKIGVISDTHGSLSAWQKAYKYLADTDLILHCGDVLYHGPRNPLPEGYNPGELAKTINGLDKPLTIIRGNCDAEIDQMLLEYPLESPYAHIITEDYPIFVHHGHQTPLTPKVLSQYKMIISGHTHLPGIKIQDGIIYLNPGSPSLPKNDPKTPTVACIDGEKIKIINIENGEVIDQR